MLATGRAKTFDVEFVQVHQAGGERPFREIVPPRLHLGVAHVGVEQLNGVAHHPDAHLALVECNGDLLESRALSRDVCLKGIDRNAPAAGRAFHLLQVAQPIRECTDGLQHRQLLRDQWLNRTSKFHARGPHAVNAIVDVEPCYVSKHQMAPLVG